MTNMDAWVEKLDLVLLVFLGMLMSDIFALEPTFDVPTVNVTVTEGKTAILPCSVENLGDHQVVWTDQWSTLLTHDIKRIIDDDRISVERPYTRDWNLLIHDVQYSDRGKYTCQINTDPIKTKHVMLHVMVPPKIWDEYSTPNVRTKEGSTVTLVCNVTGVPVPNVYWFRRPLDQGMGKKEQLTGRYAFIGPCTYTLERKVEIQPIARDHKTWIKQRVGMNGEILIIYNVSRYCDGIYECMAENNVPPAVNREMKVEVEFPPEVSLENKRIGQQPGRETILECKVTAFPLGTSVWKRHGLTIRTTDSKYRVEVYHDGEHEITLSLRISDITQDDYGDYVCVATNSIGNDNETMVLYDHRKNYFNGRPQPLPSSSTTTIAPRGVYNGYSEYPWEGPLDPHRPSNHAGEGKTPYGQALKNTSSCTTVNIHSLLFVLGQIMSAFIVIFH